ncbi:MAG: hypothetical protein D8M58_18960 [Calditrichaeota bacterium]|nr:MAG: hypothetical protein DWQ03_21640 [Calditrichota bacterium]MBL1207491.1 hypothetical protein [Calditrichota bacterium]NOG47323.1 carbohydrate binding family 9 domain-containing protein [Calditrichota bacterium]
MRSKYLIIILLSLLISTVFPKPNDQVRLNPFNKGIVLDGFLTEDVWKNATRITDFYTIQPVAGNPAEERTAALFGYDEKNLYIAFICFYDDPSVIRATVAKRDAIFEDDFILLYLDTFDAGEHAYQFAFNPFGIQGDGVYTEHVGEDFKPDFIFESHGRIFRQGYIVEAQIPFSSLNFPDKSKMNWRFAILRHTEHLNHDTVWPRISLNSTDWVGQFGRLSDIQSIQTGKGLEILPEFSSFRVDNYSSIDSSLNNGPIKGDFGLNLKYGVSSGLNLDLTFNPDFSQVESDVNKIDVNRRKPLFYSEKRPFFLEGTDIFKTPIQAVYTRQLIDPLGGIKFSGRVGDYSVGLLSTIDEYQGTTAFLGSDSATVKKYGTKKSLNNILRIKRTIFDNSSVGLLVTDREFEDTYNRVYGLDGTFAFTDNDILTLQGLHSQTKDVFSSQKTEDPAFYGNYWHGTDTWNFQIFYNDYAPDFRVDNGFIERQDIIANGFREGGLQLWYNFKWQENSLQYFRPYIYSTRIVDHENKVIEDNLWSSLFFQFDFKTEVTLSHYFSRENFGGQNFDKNNYAVDISNTSLSWLQANFYLYNGDEISYFTNPTFLGNVNYIISSLVFKPLGYLNFDFSYKYYRFTGEVNGLNEGLSQEIPRVKLSWQFYRYFALRLIAERTTLHYDDTYYSYAESGQIDVNLLFSYTPSPGTVIFLGYNDFYEKGTKFHKGWISFDKYTQAQRGFFMKLSYLFKADL